MGRCDIVKLLLDNKVGVNTSCGEEFQQAVKAGHVEMVRLLLESKADIDAEARDEQGQTALQAAAGCGHIGVVKLLLENKANVNAEPSKENGRTALQAAAEQTRPGFSWKPTPTSMPKQATIWAGRHCRLQLEAATSTW